MKGKYNINNYTGSLKIIRTPLIYIESVEIYPLPNIQILKNVLKVIPGQNGDIYVNDSKLTTVQI